MTPHAPAPPRSRPALSRPPRWLTVLGIVLLLGELTGAAVFLAAGPHGETRPRAGPNGGTQPTAGFPGGTADRGAAQTVVLRVDGVPDPSCQQEPGRCMSDVTYSRPTGTATVYSGPLPFVKEVPVPPGGIVTLTGASVSMERLACSITVDGKVVSQTATRNALNAVACHAMLPGGTTTGPPGGTRQVDLWATFVPKTPIQPAAAKIVYTTPAGSRTIPSPITPFETTISVPAGESVTITEASGSDNPVTCSIMANGRVLSQATISGRATCQARIP